MMQRKKEVLLEGLYEKRAVLDTWLLPQILEHSSLVRRK
jgi:hypothetical protein